MYINIHTHYKSNEKNHVTVYNKNISEENIDNSYFSSGIHPWFIHQNNLSENLTLLKQDLSKKKCIALGECGLDKIIKTDFNLQKDVFKQQLKLNKTHNKPVIIHCVKAYQELIEIKKEYHFTYILHGFNKNQQTAQMLLDNGFYLSFGKHLTEKESLQQVFLNTPVNRIFLETDNTTISIENIYKKASEIKKIPLESLLLAIEKNFETIFK